MIKTPFYFHTKILLISESRLLINIYRALNELNALNSFGTKGGSLL